MVRTTHTLTIASLLLLSACPSTDNNVGTILRDGGGTGGISQTGGATASQGGTVGSGGSGGGSSATGCVYRGVTYAIGESFKADCNVCTCGLLGDSQVSCSQAVCLTDAGPPPSTGGGGAGGAQAGSGGYAQDAPPDSPGCSAGTVRATPGWDGEFTAFCGLPCTTTSDCPDGSHCVELAGAAAGSPGLVCVSAANPPPMANHMGVIWDLMDNCLDSNLLALQYIDFGNHVAGREITFCPNGCIQSTLVDGGWNRPHCQ
jgi:hypothetical protein